MMYAFSLLFSGATVVTKNTALGTFPFTVGCHLGRCVSSLRVAVRAHSHMSQRSSRGSSGTLSVRRLPLMI